MESIEEVMKPLAEEGISLNPYESVPVKTEVKFWGLIISSPDPDKVKALKKISGNKKKRKTISFICMIQTNAKLYVT